jgi:hypothetical protein
MRITVNGGSRARMSFHQARGLVNVSYPSSDDIPVSVASADDLSSQLKGLSTITGAIIWLALVLFLSIGGG